MLSIFDSYRLLSFGSHPLYDTYFVVLQGTNYNEMSVVERICDEFLSDFHREDHFAAHFMGRYYRDWKKNPGSAPLEYSEKIVEDFGKQYRTEFGFGLSFVEGFASVFDKNNPDHTFQGRLKVHYGNILNKSSDYNYKADPYDHGRKWGKKHLKEISRKKKSKDKTVSKDAEGVAPTGNPPPAAVAGTADGQEQSMESAAGAVAGASGGQDDLVEAASDSQRNSQGELVAEQMQGEEEKVGGESNGGISPGTNGLVDQLQNDGHGHLEHSQSNDEKESDSDKGEKQQDADDEEVPVEEAPSNEDKNSNGEEKLEDVDEDDEDEVSDCTLSFC